MRIAGPLDELALGSPLQRAARRWAGARTSTSFRWGLGILSVAMMVLLGRVGFLALEEEQLIRSHEEALARLEQRHARIRQPAPVPAGLTPSQRSKLDGIVDRLNFPWARVLDDLERHTPGSVALLQLEPDVASGSLRLLVEARAADDLLAYIDALRAAQTLRNLRIAKYETNLQDAARPARFLLLAELVREAPVEPAPAVPSQRTASNSSIGPIR